MCYCNLVLLPGGEEFNKLPFIWCQTPLSNILSEISPFHDTLEHTACYSWILQATAFYKNIALNKVKSFNWIGKIDWILSWDTLEH